MLLLPIPNKVRSAVTLVESETERSIIINGKVGYISGNV